MIQKKQAVEHAIPVNVQDLLYQALETELCGVEIYRHALRCARNEDLEKEWLEYLAETERHVERMLAVLDSLDLDPEHVTPGRLVVRQIGKTLVDAMDTALASGAPDAAELVATECVVFAETKDHQNWSLLSKLVEADRDPRYSTLAAACAAVEGEEDEHLDHSHGWSRELWLKALDLESALPPRKSADARRAGPDAPRRRRV